MNAFVNGLKSQRTTTEKGAGAFTGTGDYSVDLFYKIGAMRGKDILPDFINAYEEDTDKAMRIVQWARDVRGGAGERDLPRHVLKWLTRKNEEHAARLQKKMPEIGRWDDVFYGDENLGASLIAAAMLEGNGLAAKWAPRNGPIANKIKTCLGMTGPAGDKAYRNLRTPLMKTVEQKMSANEWDEINFSHVPSQAMRIYKKAFKKRTPKFEEWLLALQNKTEGVKVNAGAIYPHDILRNYLANLSSFGGLSVHETCELDPVAIEQWNALPNFMENGNIFPVIDTSGSMTMSYWNSTLKPYIIAVSLGLYVADKSTGPFQGVVANFNHNCKIEKLSGSISNKILQICRMPWGGTTNVMSVFDKILEIAEDANCSDDDMPKTIVIFSDMQFDPGYTNVTEPTATTHASIKKKYETSGYSLPQVVYWNLNAADNVPVKVSERGTGVVSGFSPAVMKSILNCGDFSPKGIMLQTIMNERYDW